MTTGVATFWNYVQRYGFLFATAMLVTAFNCACVVLGVSISPLAVQLDAVVVPIALSCWVEFDARRLRRTPCYDFGYLMSILWFITLPCYLIWTRSGRGLLVGALFLFLLVVPYFITVFVAAALAVSRIV